MIKGVRYREVIRNVDNRGWLAEMHRNDDITRGQEPVMSYISMTEPGVVRGPHEHISQTDRFIFLGSSSFEVYLWDNRVNTLFGKEMEVVQAPEGVIMEFVVPPSVVHGYKNVGENPGLVLNLPNRLYRGTNKKDIVDEIRHEADSNSRFKIE